METLTFSRSFLDEKRNIGDPIADAIIGQAFANAERKKELFEWMQMARWYCIYLPGCVTMFQSIGPWQGTYR